MGLGADSGPEQARFSQEGRWGGGHLCASCPPLPPGHAGRSSAWLCFWPAGSVPTPAHGQRGGFPPPGGSATSRPPTRGAPLSPPHVHPETWEEPGGRLTARPMCSWQSQAGIPPCPPLSSPPFNTHTHTHPRSLLCQLLQRGPQGHVHCQNLPGAGLAEGMAGMRWNTMGWGRGWQSGGL